MTFTSNNYLSLSQMKVNAQYIMNYFSKQGWTKNSIAGMLGNMQRESTINSGLWQSRAEGRYDLGYGLVQWTPATIIHNYANSLGKNPSDINMQCGRIIYELKNNLQWITRSDYPTTFKQFTKSKRSPEDLAEIFCLNYERAGIAAMSERQANARYWYDNLKGSGGGGGGGGNNSGYQLAEFPMEIINISQGENGSYSHQGTLCMDFVRAPSLRFPYYAPCDCTCINQGFPDAYLIWKSDKKVMCADGEVRSIVWSCFHENAPTVHRVGSKIKKGALMGYSGTGGNVTGDHVHFNIINGTKYTGFVQKPGYALAGTELHIYDVWAIKEGTNIVQGGGYDWKGSEWVDGEEDTGGGEGDSLGEDLITLWLVDALNGWKF